VLKITLLGCGGSAGVPSPGGADGAGDWGACDPAEPRNRRTRSSILLESQEKRLLIDTSPDMRDQLLACRVPKVDAILFTHAHADHIAGFDDVRLLNRAGGAPIPIFGTEPTLAEIRRRFDYAFRRPWQPPWFFWPVTEPRAVAPGEVLEVAGLRLTLFEQDHEVTRTLGLRIGDFAYSTDLVRLEPPALAALRGVDTWLVGCFQRQPHATHAHLAQILAWARDLGVRRTVLTHMGADLDWDWMRRHLPEGVEPGFDGMVLHAAGA
jgi:phosphoribosyl 1,2-cyclic phosphate phosphodiesterase